MKKQLYHVDDNNNVEDMDGTVDAEGNVVFEARISLLVINKRQFNITTLQHYINASKKNFIRMRQSH